MKWLFLGLYIINSILHLVYSYRDDKEKRAMTKPFLLIFLMLFYMHANEDWNWFLVLALLTSWLGDVLLIPKGHHWFAMGGVSFMFSHFFFIAVYVHRVALSWWYFIILIPLLIVYFGISLKIIHAVKDNTPKIMVFPMYFYLLCNSTMNLFALLQLLSLRSFGSFVAYLGAVLFFVSDCTLFLVRYHKNENIIYKKHFTVMLTYLLGELLITIGVMMIGG